MEFSEEDVINCADVLRNEVPLLLTTEFKDYVENTINYIKEVYQKDDALFRVRLVEIFNHLKEKRKPYELVYLIRMVTMENIIIRYDVVPEFMDIVDTYDELIRQSRNYKWKDNK